MLVLVFVLSIAGEKEDAVTRIIHEIYLTKHQKGILDDLEPSI